MTESYAKHLDSIGWKIITELQHNARLPFAELGRRVGLSTPAVMERVHRLEEAGIIRGYHAEVDHGRVGYPILAYIGINVVGDFMPRMKDIVQDVSEVLECHGVTGANSFLMKVVVSSVDELEKLIDQFSPYVATTTSLVLSSLVTTRAIVNK